MLRGAARMAGLSLYEAMRPTIGELVAGLEHVDLTNVEEVRKVFKVK